LRFEVLERERTLVQAFRGCSLEPRGYWIVRWVGGDLRPPHPAFFTLAEEPDLMHDLNHRHARCD
jgi:hypothetical protein